MEKKFKSGVALWPPLIEHLLPPAAFKPCGIGRASRAYDPDAWGQGPGHLNFQRGDILVRFAPRLTRSDGYVHGWCVGSDLVVKVGLFPASAWVAELP